MKKKRYRVGFRPTDFGWDIKYPCGRVMSYPAEAFEGPADMREKSWVHSNMCAEGRCPHEQAGRHCEFAKSARG